MYKIFTMTLALALVATAARLAAQQPEVKPGPEHDVLKQEEGVWDVTIKSKEGDSKGVHTAKMGLNGLWILDHFKADFGGMAFEGMGATSYDPAKKKYMGTWIDSMSTSPMVSEGTYDKATKTLTMVGNMPMPDGKSVKTTMTTVFKDADNKTFTMRTAGPDGKGIEMLNASYKRRAK